MPARLALFIAIVFILWLLTKERKSRNPLSLALWLPLAWAFIVGSKPVTEWLGSGTAGVTTINYIEGSPLDRLILFSLIAAGLLVIFLRRESWTQIIWDNKWVFAFYLYLGLSVLWSDYSFVSLKRWIKDFGNIVMALVVLSEEEPWEALKSVLLRCAIILIPLSIVLVKYYPDLGRYYDRWSYSVYFRGVTGDKNLLGMMLFVTALFLFYMFLETLKREPGDARQLSLIVPGSLLLMVFWLLMKAQSASAVLCTGVGAVTLYVLHKSGPRRLIIYGLFSAVPVIFIGYAFDLASLIGRMLGRDSTLTGRTEIWRTLLSEKVNPIFGEGFYSFWLGERAEKLSERYHYALNEAHNGYLELYLNSGLIGLVLLGLLLWAAIRFQWKDLKLGIPGAAFKFSFLIGTLVYNISEATFNRLSIIWFTFLLIVVVYPRPHEEYEKLDAAGRISAAETPGRTVQAQT